MTITVGGTSITFNDATTQTTAPVNTNANVTSITAGSGISVSATTGAITISTSGGGGVTSLNGQTGAVVTTDLGAIGAVAFAFNTGTSNMLANSTIAGSSLGYPNTVSQSSGLNYYTGGTGGTLPRSIIFVTSNTWGRTNGGNTGYVAPQGISYYSGTWRCLGACGSRNSNYDACNGETSSTNGATLYVRIS
jgi:hypothetical protein